MLEAPLCEHGHVDAEHRANAARDNLALEGVETLRRSLGQRGERYRLGHGDDGRTRVRTERREALLARAGITPHATAAVPARIRERVLDRVDPPAFLVQH